MTLRSKVLSGLFWTGGARLLSQLVTWAITIVVIRLLSPGDYGLMAMATVFVNFLILLSEAGLGAALVQAPEMDDVKLRRVFGAVILIDSALFALLFAAAPAIADFFAEERLVVIVRLLSLQFLLMMFTVIPIAMLSRRLDFKRQSMVELAGAVFGSLCTLGLALSGYGVWSLVVGSLISAVLKAVAINVVAPFLKRPDFSLTDLRGFIAFGGQLTASRVLWFFYSQADIFIAGKLLGTELLGFYSVSMHLASLPVQKITAVINQVAFPAFAQSQHSPEALSQYLLKALRVMAFFAFPVLWGISSIAPEIVAVLLGDKWQPAVLPLQLLPLVMPLSMFSPVLNSAFQGIGRGGVVFMNVLTASLIMPVAFLIGVRWGLIGLSLAWLFGFPLVFVATLQRMLPLVGLRFADVLVAIGPSVLAGALMYAAVAGVRWFFGGGLPAPLMMGLLIAAGAASYAAVAFVANRKGVDEIVALFGGAR